MTTDMQIFIFALNFHD